MEIKTAIQRQTR